MTLEDLADLARCLSLVRRLVRSLACVVLERHPDGLTIRFPMPKATLTLRLDRH
jgi:hypothetical protein